jgi:hypothetical protein
MNYDSDIAKKIKLNFYKKQNNNDKKITYFLIFFIIVFSLFNFWLFSGKYILNNFFVDNKPKEEINQIDLEKNELNNQIVVANQKIDELNQKIEMLSEKIWILSLVSNENTSLVCKINQRQGYQNPGYIFIKENWKLNKIPSTIKLTQEQKDKIVD